MEQVGAVQAPIVGSTLQTEQKNAQQGHGVPFSDMLQEAIHKVDEYQQSSEQLTEKLITGEVDDLHQVTMAAQKASLTMQLTVQVRNKVIDAYEEMMRMQV